MDQWGSMANGGTQDSQDDRGWWYEVLPTPGPVTWGMFISGPSETLVKSQPSEATWSIAQTIES